MRKHILFSKNKKNALSTLINILKNDFSKKFEKCSENQIINLNVLSEFDFKIFLMLKTIRSIDFFVRNIYSVLYFH